jgi:flagellar basal body-associated protein FliL
MPEAKSTTAASAKRTPSGGGLNIKLVAAIGLLVVAGGMVYWFVFADSGNSTSQITGIHSDADAPPPPAAAQIPSTNTGSGGQRRAPGR